MSFASLVKISRSWRLDRLGVTRTPTPPDKQAPQLLRSCGAGGPAGSMLGL